MASVSGGCTEAAKLRDAAKLDAAFFLFPHEPSLLLIHGARAWKCGRHYVIVRDKQEIYAASALLSKLRHGHAFAVAHLTPTATLMMDVTTLMARESIGIRCVSPTTLTCFFRETEERSTGKARSSFWTRKAKGYRFKLRGYHAAH